MRHLRRPRPPRLQVCGASSVAIVSAAEAMAAIRAGVAGRAVAATGMNEASSRR